MNIISELMELQNPHADRVIAIIWERDYSESSAIVLRQFLAKINDSLQCGGFYHNDTFHRLRRVKRALYRLITWLEYKHRQDKAMQFRDQGFVNGSYYHDVKRG